MFWNPQHILNLPEVAGRSMPERVRIANTSFFLIISASIAGNFFAGLLARFIGYRRAIAWMFLGMVAAFIGTYCVPRNYLSLLWWSPWIGFFSGVFGLFTMYLPPLFPTLLRTTGAGFSYNIGRIVAAVGTVFFGLFANVGDFRLALLYDGCLFIPAILVALFMPEPEGSAEP